jgi:hypothetical protein
MAGPVSTGACKLALGQVGSPGVGMGKVQPLDASSRKTTPASTKYPFVFIEFSSISYISRASQ